MDKNEQPPMFPKDPDAQEPGIVGPTDGMSDAEVAEHIAEHTSGDFDPNKPPSEAAEGQGHRLYLVPDEDPAPLGNVIGINDAPGKRSPKSLRDAKNRHPSTGPNKVLRRKKPYTGPVRGDSEMDTKPPDYYKPYVPPTDAERAGIAERARQAKKERDEQKRRFNGEGQPPEEPEN
jgi:hypothetical protein